ncbi:MAG: 50S ribosomal protein L13 [Candidatus Jacksonbacteria bacterium RIFOXYA2_FULL_44_7]|uniref:Large ribosomal subunit protein uL13 n=1 Tax=Candidatus Jacksonbacteria bacterium RIFCSPLOWO2_02_FULL_44_20 TaxID=1798460 RepID=A0A1G2A9A5_9BACT|nr:MAG: 50S ribosomal protein L13 [Parcubacteria group bacterium GW2011_GWC2_44_17]KKT50234.1 MAG: 50S ribosomal protein L13 [Parcubacteria group bacterium GW2011_GWF2_44_17]OGY71232.1 MAG: 50S ribosomal protein L13 [Candidatus Jacksonbacteria bacterium RIFCSPHIGHO2_12_FULL_44_12]OGY71697.1 MAG: 50S ribosomal protein L13 [Candidatus Jacksonbacteria bacterium RIFCSPHIGHO2_02_FULL_44_25]OGY73483.1 MAG: 50S ribosomal protein L13 [Candidatus Jacksonbacteria bacterium RIFCSPLOWO2_02_FULL_44_20]OGY7
MIHLDATNQALGRLASQISQYLLGKHKSEFVPYKNVGDKVEVANVDMIKITGNKLAQKVYYHHTLYPGHLKQTSMHKLLKSDMLKRAVWNMLPKNKLREERMKNLTIKL